ncbi:transcriptional regulator LysR family protein [Scytonema sp. HK-05]|uniref:LysR family transcriptional regulator n=1 Tax=Scytonema sp. HK-05 TaxID=1137095 RepID=UPI000937BC5C|nr:LysR family transcriptional regulator [Scytonema sp. HK-05]OKH57755.1 LysR family transcriptional regulator [Scytonema sp. HK-05]BAY48080.1 transcriptional regulator LysR family protein [Scytonema sp. HK-05]
MDFKRLNQFELQKICNFMAVVQAGNNFSEAAKRLGIHQPNLTHSIQALEKSLSANSKTSDIKLFDRSKRPIELTEAGKVFLKEVQLALIHLDQAIAQAQQASLGQIGRLIVGLNNAVANSILPNVLNEFQNQFPNVQLELREVTIQQEIQMLKNCELDVVFQRSPSFDQNDPDNDPDLEFQLLLNEYFVVALPINHALAKQKDTGISLKALANETIILPPLDVLPFYGEVITLCRNIGFEPKIAPNIIVTGVVVLLSLVASEKGISILPNHVQTLQREGVIYKAIKDAKLTRQIAAVWRKKNSSMVLSNFLKVIEEILGVPDGW